MPVRGRMGARTARGPIAGDLPRRSPLRRSLAGRLGGALEKKHADDVAVLETLRSIPAAQLSSEDQLNQELFRRLYQGTDDAYAWGLQYMPITQRSGVQTAAETAELHRVRDRAGLRELDRAARRHRRLRGPDHRADARGHAARTRAAEGDHAARPGPDREADRRGPRGQPVLQAVPHDAGDDPAGRAGTAACRDAGCDRADGRARIPQAAGLLHEGLPAGLPRFGRRLGRCPVARPGTRTASAGSRPRISPPTRSTRSA